MLQGNNSILEIIYALHRTGHHKLRYCPMGSLVFSVIDGGVWWGIIFSPIFLGPCSFDSTPRLTSFCHSKWAPK